MHTFIGIAHIFLQNSLPPPPINWLYTGLLGLIAILLGIIGWLLKSAYADMKEWRLETDKWIRTLDTRLVRIETKLEIQE
jgi:hypothetical protein